MINVLIREFAPEQQWLTERPEAVSQTMVELVDADALSHRAAGKLLQDALCAIPATFAFGTL
jgi:hypothetical protein